MYLLKVNPCCYLHNCSVLFKWEFFIQMRASCLPLSFHQKRGATEREEGCKISHFNLNEKLAFEKDATVRICRTTFGQRWSSPGRTGGTTGGITVTSVGWKIMINSGVKQDPDRKISKPQTTSGNTPVSIFTRFVHNILLRVRHDTFLIIRIQCLWYSIPTQIRSGH